MSVSLSLSLSVALALFAAFTWGHRRVNPCLQALDLTPHPHELVAVRIRVHTRFVANRRSARAELECVEALGKSIVGRSDTQHENSFRVSCRRYGRQGDDGSRLEKKRKIGE